jgi:hypothetical protein
VNYKYYNLMPPIEYLRSALSFAHVGDKKRMDFLLDKYFQSRNMPVCDALVGKMYGIFTKSLLHK